MKGKLFLFLICAGLFLCSNIFAQTHISVPLENRIYYILEQAELKGLCSPLSGSRPYTQSTIIAVINEILLNKNSRTLNETEYEVLQQYLEQHTDKNGFDPQRGSYRSETSIGGGIPLTFNAGTSLHTEGSFGFYDSFSENYSGTETWVGLSFSGDIGRNVTWAFSGEGGLTKAPREELGWYNTYYEDFISRGEYINEKKKIHSQPLTHFPYSYKKRWDGSVHYLDELDNFNSWPQTASIVYNIKPELTSSFWGNKLIMRLGRVSHEWGSTPFGSSLALNQMSRPFLAIEGEFKPLSWLTFSSMTGFLEFFNREGEGGGEKGSGMTFQNAYSVTMLQLRFKNYLFLDLGETVVWPKRFELGYLFPLMSNIIYKGFVGDFDNLGVFLNIKAQYPGIGNVWFSFFGDEARFVSNMGELDRSMLAWQTGANFSLPFLSFSSLKLSYTKVNPYCYTHNRNHNPWYGELRMEASYTNNGVALGHYIPPNSDEFLIGFRTMPQKNLTLNLQYQLIRHGADFGTSAVDGSNLLSELDPDGREGSNPVLKRFFLKDGAYQWMHIIRAGAEWNLPSQPIAFFGEVGVNYSYFTNTEEEANSGAANPYSRINTGEYPKSTGFIVKLGVRIFSR